MTAQIQLSDVAWPKSALNCKERSAVAERQAQPADARAAKAEKRLLPPGFTFDLYFDAAAHDHSGINE